eukprot:snap_masked-scaffold_20-processed-gene-5.44-mRNA-1 protein AED:1.00 eAED:1.00 QI:0/0/0/0/1/1/2/0/365
MDDNSLICNRNVDCTHGLFCYPNLYQKELNSSKVCSCARVYGWTGVDCLDYGIGSFFLFTISTIIVKTQTKFTIQIITRLVELWTRDSRTGKSFLRRDSTIPLYSIQFLKKLKTSFRWSNALIFKAQLLYFLLGLALLTALLDFTYLYTLFNPDDIYTEGTQKWLPGKKARDIFILTQRNIFFLTILQISVCWLSIAMKGVFSTEQNLHYAKKMIYLIRFFQVVLPISFFVCYKRVPSIFNISNIFFGVYGLATSAVYFCSRPLFKKMSNAQDPELKRQAKLLNTCVKDIFISAFIVSIATVPIAILADRTPSLPLWLIKTIYPEKGGVNYYILVPHIIRTFGYGYLICCMVKYFDRSVAPPYRI